MQGIGGWMEEKLSFHVMQHLHCHTGQPWYNIKMQCNSLSLSLSLSPLFLLFVWCKFHSFNYFVSIFEIWSKEKSLSFIIWHHFKVLCQFKWLCSARLWGLAWFNNAVLARNNQDFKDVSWVKQTIKLLWSCLGRKSGHVFPFWIIPYKDSFLLVL